MTHSLEIQTNTLQHMMPLSKNENPLDNSGKYALPLPFFQLQKKKKRLRKIIFVIYYLHHVIIVCP